MGLLLKIICWQSTFYFSLRLVSGTNKTITAYTQLSLLWKDEDRINKNDSLKWKRDDVTPIHPRKRLSVLSFICLVWRIFERNQFWLSECLEIKNNIRQKKQRKRYIERASTMDKKTTHSCRTWVSYNIWLCSIVHYYGKVSSICSKNLHVKPLQPYSEVNPWCNPCFFALRFCLMHVCTERHAYKLTHVKFSKHYIELLFSLLKSGEHVHQSAKLGPCCHCSTLHPSMLTHSNTSTESHKQGNWKNVFCGG